MLTLVIGGSASGKSAFAESLLAEMAGPRVYLATMRASDGESRGRIARHRAQRAHLGFTTVECPLRLEDAPVPEGAAVLLEDLGNLVANEMYAPDGAGEETEQAVLRGVDALLARCRDLVIVSVEVFSGGDKYAGDTLRYLRVLARLHIALAKKADRVAEVACGQAVYWKGGKPT